MLPLTRSRNRSRFFGIPFSPSALFQGGTVAGAWYDPSDLSTMFTTSTGTTPVAMPGQGAPVPVGLMLDKSQGLVLGPELTTGILNSSTNWTLDAAGSVTGGALVINTPVITASIQIYVPPVAGTFVVGKFYRITFNVTRTQGTITVAIGSAPPYNSGNITASGAYSLILPCGGGTPNRISFTSGASAVNNFIGSISNISVRELPGNHAIAFNNTTARPELRARVNLLTYSEEFDNGAWTKNNSTVANTTATTDPLGGTTAYVYTNTGSGDWLNTASAITIVAGLNYTYSIYAKRGTQDWFRLSGWNDVTGTGATQAFNAWFNLATGVKGTLSSGADGTAVSHDMVSVGNGWYRCTVVGRSTALTTLFPELNMTTADAVTTRPATGNEVYIWGADLRPANIGANVPAYQRIADANTYDTSGFPLYLYFDGTDDGMSFDSMVAGTSYFEGANAPFVMFAGARRETTGSFQIIASMWDNTDATPSQNDALQLAFRDTTTQILAQIRDYNAGIFDKFVYAGTNAAPETGVITWQRTTTDGVARYNGVAGTPADQTQPALALALASIGVARRGTGPDLSSRLRGNIYSLIIAGSAVSAGNISATEQYIANKTGIQI